MREIIDRLRTSRIDEARKKVALEALATELKDKLSKVEGYSHHKLSISPNYDEGCVDVLFRGTDDAFRVYPQKTKISNENSNKVISVSSIDGAYILGTKVYDEEGNLLGEALVRTKAVHNKSDYSEDLTKAEYRFNSKITNLQKLEKYIAREAINNMEKNSRKRRDS